jgi:hypothetical protein
MQEDRILALMRACGEASPWELWVIYNRIMASYPFRNSYPECIKIMRRWDKHHWVQAQETIKDRVPITSIRRALTNLTEQGLLVKTDLQRMGAKGKPEYIWKVKSQTNQL